MLWPVFATFDARLAYEHFQARQLRGSPVWSLGMTLGRARLPLVILSAFAISSCQTEDKSPQPRFTTNSRGQKTTGTAQANADTHFIEFRSRCARPMGILTSFSGVWTRTESGDRSGGACLPCLAGCRALRHGHFIPVPATTGQTDGDLESSDSGGKLAGDAHGRRIQRRCRFYPRAAKRTPISGKRRSMRFRYSNWVGEIARS